MTFRDAGSAFLNAWRRGNEIIVRDQNQQGNEAKEIGDHRHRRACGAGPERRTCPHHVAPFISLGDPCEFIRGTGGPPVFLDQNTGGPPVPRRNLTRSQDDRCSIPDKLTTRHPPARPPDVFRRAFRRWPCLPRQALRGTITFMTTYWSPFSAARSMPCPFRRSFAPLLVPGGIVTVSRPSNVGTVTLVPSRAS